MLNDKARAEKHLRAMQRELNRLNKRLRNPPVHELIPPIQRGWKRHFVMTPAALRQGDASVLAAILARLNTVRYFWNRTFRSNRRRRQQRMTSIEQELRVLSFEQWRRETIPEEWRRYFRLAMIPRGSVDRTWRHRQRGSWIYPALARPRRGYIWAYIFRQPEFFVLRVEKHWLTHYSELEPEIIKRIAEIEHWMKTHHGHERYHRLKGGSWRWWYDSDDRRKHQDREAQREIRAHLGFLGDVAADHIPSVQPCWGARRGGMFSAAVGPRETRQIFAAVRLELLRHQPPDTRPGSLTGYRHAGQGS